VRRARDALSRERGKGKKSRLAGLKVTCYTHGIPRDGPPLELTARKESAVLMATSNFFWKLFAQTGSIDAYLAYRNLHAPPSPA
jgi:YqzL-like protein